jgi:hypothetical protein
MPASEFVIETDPTPEQVQYLEDRLYEFNSSVTRITDGEWLAIFVRDGEQIVAGICGSTWAVAARFGSSGWRSRNVAGAWGRNYSGQQSTRLADAAVGRSFSQRSPSKLQPFTRSAALRLWLP